MKFTKESIFIPSLYFLSGLPYIIVNNLSVIWFKNLNMDLALIAKITSLYYIPWIIKFIWAPFVDLYSTKRNWILSINIILSILFFILGIFSYFYSLSLSIYILLFIIALVSASQDNAIDGYYLEVLEEKQQAFYVGIRNSAYKIAWFFCTGFLVWLVSQFEKHFSVNNSWSLLMEFIAILLFIILAIHSLILPNASDNNNKSKKFNNYTLNKIVYSIKAYFKQKYIVNIIFFIMFYRMGEALLLKMANPFLMDSYKNHGLNLGLESIGLIYGTYGMLSLLIGGIIGGYMISRHSLEKLIFPFGLFMNLALFDYYILTIIKSNFTIITILNCIEQFGYGIGISAYTVLLLHTVNPKFKATHYSITTALMAIAVFIPQYISGTIAESIGYNKYFLLCSIIGLLGLSTIKFLPVAKICNKS